MDNGTGKRIYREESLKGLNSPEELDVYVTTNRPWWWALGLGLAVLLSSTVGWLFFGHLPLTANIKGMVTDNTHITAYADAASFTTGLEDAFVSVSYLGRNIGTGKVVSIDEHPYSQLELNVRLSSDWLRSNMVTSQFMRRLVIQMDEPVGVDEETLCDVTITLSDKHPIEYFVNGR
ncbi:MAG: hypothetical protein SPF89_05305 [Sphaerochaetaceae bacterium]|nr:hypothetical protein [Spirochaetales bacterium]MDY5499503.1 hypothetical protein [Sphaerochaetaceae bacterium]